MAAITVGDVFNAAMGIMDELSTTGEPQTTDTKEYEYRTPAIINMMLGEIDLLTGNTEEWLAVEGLDDLVPNVSSSYARSAMPYGLAANLLVDENPSSASFFQQRYEEMKNLYVARQPAEISDITDLYGMRIEYGEFSRW